MTAESHAPTKALVTTRRARIALVVAMLASHLVLLLACAFNKSACFDEGAHLTAGLAYLRHAEFRIYNLSPPLLRMWAAIPAYLGGADVRPAKQMGDYSASERHWLYFRDFQNFPVNLAHLHQFILWGRLMLIPFSLAGAVMLFAWAYRLYGFFAGAVACAAWSFSPLIIATGSTLGTDMPTAVTMMAGFGAWARFLRTYHNRDAAMAALAVAAALAMKFTAILLIAPLSILAVIAIYRNRTSLKHVVTGAALVAVVSFVLVNLTYGFRLFGLPLGTFTFRSSLMQRVDAVVPESMPVPFPRDMVEGFDAQAYEVDIGFPTTLLGEGYLFNDWRYYPWAVATKSTIGGLILVLLGAASFVRRRPSPQEIPLIIYVLSVGGAIVVLGNINVGLRYLLPVYPAAIILISRSATWTSIRFGATLAALALAAESMAAAPRYHSFCNLAARPWKQTVPDLDWGQSLIDLRKWMHAHHQDRISMVYFGSVLPSAYGIDAANPLNEPLTQFIAISRNALNGLPVRTPDGFVLVRCWKSLRSASPVADLGGMLVFRATDVALAPQQPPIADGRSWQKIIDDPELVPFRDREVIRQRISAASQPSK